MNDQNWKPLLERLNRVMLKAEGFPREHCAQEMSKGWCGWEPASDATIQEVEARLGLQLPPSYRSFLLCANGWRPFGSFLLRLLPVQELAPLRTADPDFTSFIESPNGYREVDATDAEYLDYETPEGITAIRARHYPDSILISQSWGDGELLLLNPNVVFAGGEWETIFFGNWLPGNERYRSFRNYMEHHIGMEEMLDASRVSRDAS